MRTANENVIRALSRALSEARAGNVEAVGIICASPDGVPEVSFGGEGELIAAVNLGADLLKAKFTEQLMIATQGPTTSIRRPVSAGQDN